MKTIARIVTAGVATVALAGGIGVGIASADPTSPPPTANPTSTTTAKPDSAAHKAAKAHHKRNLARRALHGEVTLGGKKHRVVVFQRGTVQKVSATSLTVKSADGFTATYVLTDKTKVHKAKKAAAVADLETADRVRVVATRAGSTVTAQKIGDAGPR